MNINFFYPYLICSQHALCARYILVSIKTIFFLVAPYLRCLFSGIWNTFTWPVILVLQGNMVSPFSMHQQQIAMLAQQQSLLMAAAAKSSGGDLKYPAGIQEPRPNVPVQSWPATGYSISGVLPMQVMTEVSQMLIISYWFCPATNLFLFYQGPITNMTPAHFAGSPVQYQPSRYWCDHHQINLSGLLVIFYLIITLCWSI